LLKKTARGAVELMQDACDRLQSLENAAFIKKYARRNKRKGAKTQRRKGRGSLREIHYARATTGDPRPRRGVGLSQRQIEIGLERFLWVIVRTVGVDFKAG
jgi:hypothetical protein